MSWSMPSTTTETERAASAASYRLTSRRREFLLGGPDGTARLVVELDRQVRDPSCRDVGGDVDLAATHDALVDDARAGGGVEPVVGRGQPGLLERCHQGVARLRAIDPPEELPDGLEVLDVVDQRGAGQRHEQGARVLRPDALGELQHVLGTLRGLVLDEVRLVDDHAAEAVRPEPADVPVEDLVVDDDDVGEAVDGVTVAVDDRRRTSRRPELRLARPVRLDDVGHDDEQGKGTSSIGSQQRLSRLAETGLVGQQEGAVSFGSGGDHLGLVVHQLETLDAVHDSRRLRQRHARGVAAVLEGAEQRREQLPPAESVRPRPGRGESREVRREERIRELPGDDGLGHDSARRRRCERGGRRDHWGGFGLGFAAGRTQQVVLQVDGGG
jgi:hypothetical protein